MESDLRGQSNTPTKPPAADITLSVWLAASDFSPRTLT
jgi:hypothetical protein